MSTLEPPRLRALADRWDSGMDYPSAVFAGIVGDSSPQHAIGYHRSIEDQGANYSTTRPDDAAPPGGWSRRHASAVDMALNRQDMILCHGRLCAVWRNRANDPRARYINAHNGWDGAPDGPGRYDWVTGHIEAASSDHEWHIHLEVRRCWWDDPVAMDAIGSILSGESLADYLARITGSGVGMDDGELRSRLDELRFWGIEATRRSANTESVVDSMASGSADFAWHTTQGSYDPTVDRPNPLTALAQQVASLAAAVAQLQAATGGLSDADRQLLAGTRDAVAALNNRLATP